MFSRLALEQNREASLGQTQIHSRNDQRDPGALSRTLTCAESKQGIIYKEVSSGMIKGIGIDIIDISRIEKGITEHGRRLIDRIFSSDEIAYCEARTYRSRHYAARFAAKEALFKALGTGLGQGMSWQDVEIANDDRGQPRIHLSRKARDLADHLGIARTHLSLSHDRHNAVAVVMLEARENNMEADQSTQKQDG